MPGEIAEMMLEGFMCQGCGDIIGDSETGEGLGYPGFCAACQPDEGYEHAPPEQPTERKRRLAVTMEARCCLFCGKKCKSERGAIDHMRDVHRATVTWARLPDDPSPDAPACARVA